MVLALGAVKPALFRGGPAPPRPFRGSLETALCANYPPLMATKLEAFLDKEKISARRLLSASRQLERLRAEDRRIKLVQKRARKSEDGKKPEGLAKPRSGRPVTKVTLENAVRGKCLSSAAKTRILRAVNRVLEQRKKDAVALDALFDLQPAPKPAADASDES